MAELNRIKKILYDVCKAQIELRITTAREALDAAVAAANEETKSSAGDKYETGRAMMQMEQDKSREQLSKAMQLLNELAQIKPEKIYPTVAKGSLVLTDSGQYFIAVGIGKVLIEGKTYYVISPDAPIGKVLMGKKEGEVFVFQDKNHLVKQLF